MTTDGIIGLVISFVVAAVIIFPLGGLLRRHPSPFYIVFIALTALYAWAFFNNINMTNVRFLSVIMQKGYLASIFLFVVMFTGVLNEGTWLRKKLQPIRGELSILSFIFILGHLVTYLPSYLPHLDVLLSSRTNIALSVIVALILTVVFCVLAVLSLRIIRRTMNKRVWKGIQRASYVMMALLVLHIGLMLGASAFGRGFTLATGSFIVYTAIVVLYAILRIRKAVSDHTHRATPPENAACLEEKEDHVS